MLRISFNSYLIVHFLPYRFLPNSNIRHAFVINYDENKMKVIHKEPGSDPKSTENRGLETNLRPKSFSSLLYLSLTIFDFIRSLRHN